MAEGIRLELSGLIFKRADHPECEVDEWRTDDPQYLVRVDFNYRRDPIGIASFHVESTGDLHCSAKVITGSICPDHVTMATLVCCRGWSLGYHLRGEHRRIAYGLVPSVLAVPANLPVDVPQPPLWRLKARFPRILVSELAPLENALVEPPDLFEVGLSPRGDVVPVGPGVVPLDDDVALRWINEQRVRARR